ncbi:MAG: hypothetical protein E7L17_14045 [Clostridium sp.]|uniref:hypothetical protein n=1 Tax=Clostridium sp. TaxID=1506 RepID=UPI002910D2FF|nr:hypothetical protein [Clostridium sp.]MDU7339220.1 hypothetical protein [Clostridium sp.]
MPCLYDDINEKFKVQNEIIKNLESENSLLKEQNKTLTETIESMSASNKSLQDSTLTLTQGLLQMEYEKELEKLGGNK